MSDLAWILLAIVGFWVGRFLRPAQAVVGGILVAAATGALLWADDTLPPVPVVATVAPGFVVGRLLRDRRQVQDRLRARARELEDEREAYAQLSVRYERARIAAELHDIVAHAISVMVVQAAAGQRLARVDPDMTAETFAAIGSAAREAEQDLERLVGLLAGSEPIGSTPDLRLVEDLVARAAGTGLDVSLELAGDRDGLPESIVQAAYRVVQESVTNALRHAAGSPVRIVVRGERDDLVVEVCNDAATRPGPLDGAGTGNGLRGLYERLGELGGALVAGPSADGGWAVRARMPRHPSG
jgi:signal transduction histidine kinase